MPGHRCRSLLLLVSTVMIIMLGSGCAEMPYRKSRTTGEMWAMGPGMIVHGSGHWYADDNRGFLLLLGSEIVGGALMYAATIAPGATVEPDGTVDVSRGLASVAFFGGLTLFFGGWAVDMVNTPRAVEDWNVAHGFGRQQRTVPEVVQDILGLRPPPSPVLPQPERPAPSPEGMLALAVAPFSAHGVTENDAAIVTDWVRAGLVSAGTVKVVDRQNMERLLAEQAFQMTGCTSTECAVRAGKVLNVKRMVTGTVSRLQGMYVVTAGLVDVETGAYAYSDMAKGASADELILGTSELAQRLAQGIR